LLEWLRRSGNRAYIARAAVEWYEPEVLAVLSEIFPIERFLAKPAGTRSPMVGVLIAIMAVGVILGTLFFISHTMTMSSLYSTGPGVGRRIELEDGTPVMLNAGTVLIAGFTDHTRFVDLVSGEASFAVKPDALRPFRLRVGGRDLVANSTVFDVQVAATKSVTLTVLKGSAVVFAADANLKNAALETQHSSIFVDTSVGPLETLQFSPHLQSEQKISGQQAQLRLAWQRRIPPAKTHQRWWPWMQ
jgi:ferric-dicitrate binding protein FerR (iron transport regulator)